MSSTEEWLLTSRAGNCWFSKLRAVNTKELYSAYLPFLYKLSKIIPIQLVILSTRKGREKEREKKEERQRKRRRREEERREKEKRKEGRKKRKREREGRREEETV